MAEEMLEILNQIQKIVDQKLYLDISRGIEEILGIRKATFTNVLILLKRKGYVVHYVRLRQKGTARKTTVKVLCKPGTSFQEIFRNRNLIAKFTVADTIDTYDALYHEVTKLIPGATFDNDNYGQLIIYTGLMTGEDNRTLVEFKEPDDAEHTG